MDTLEKAYNPTNGRKNFYSILKDVNANHTPILIQSNRGDDESAVIIGKKDWEAMQETLYLEQTGVGKIVREREKDDSGFTDIDDIDWDSL